jgi:heavy metal sensor kinase
VIRWPSTLRTRLTLWYTALLGVPFVLLAAASYFVFAHSLRTRTDRFIGDALAAFARELAAERRASPSTMDALQTTADEVRFRDLGIMILDRGARVIAVSPVPEGDAAARRAFTNVAAQVSTLLGARNLSLPQTLSIHAGETPYRIVSRPVHLEKQDLAVVGLYSLADIDGVLGLIRRLFAIVVPLLLVGAASGGYFLAGRSLAPVASMASRAAEISATNLDERLPVGGGDELVHLARVFNDLLDRLESSFAQQRRFMADASHELRTPTAILRTEVDVTLAQPHRTEGEYRGSLTVLGDATRRLTRIVEDLFLLARADSGQLVPRAEALYLEEIVHDVTRGLRPLAERRGVRVELRDVVPAPFHGDADLLRGMLFNLVDNAIKYSARGGVVDVTLGRAGGAYELFVIDNGPGIPLDVHERIFERFYRVDAARSRAEESTTSGAGLGLPIARRIAELHGGRLELVESRPGGGHTVFRVTLPAEEEPAAMLV